MHDGVAVAVDEGRVHIPRRALRLRFRHALRRRALRRRTLRSHCHALRPGPVRSVQGGHLHPHARHEARSRGALARELRCVLGDVHAQREDLVRVRVKVRVRIKVRVRVRVRVRIRIRVRDRVRVRSGRAPRGQRRRP